MRESGREWVGDCLAIDDPMLYDADQLVFVSSGDDTLLASAALIVLSIVSGMCSFDVLLSLSDMSLNSLSLSLYLSLSITVRILSLRGE